MDELQLYDQILSLTRPWSVSLVELDETQSSVNIIVEHDPDEVARCPECGEVATRYDSRKRVWRHLDTCQFQTFVHAEVPRVKCKKHGVHQIKVTWAEDRSRFTSQFESHVIDWLKESTISGVSRRLGLSWNAIDGIMQRAIKRGLARRSKRAIEHISVDEIAIKKGHNYVTVISNEEGIVLSVEENRTKQSLEAFYTEIEGETRNIKTVSMDMSQAYIRATKNCLPNWEDVICFDRFHVMQDLNKAVNQVRKFEMKNLERDLRLSMHRTRFTWLRSDHTLTKEHRNQINTLTAVATKTARAWAIKQYAGDLWDYKTKVWAQKAWKKWYDWAIRSRLTPIKTAAKSIKKNLWGIINAIVYKRSNARAEAINGKIKSLKHRSKGFTNQQRFKNAILFNFGGLNLYP